MHVNLNYCSNLQTFKQVSGGTGTTANASDKHAMTKHGFSLYIYTR